jgi:dTDP-4-dehydrorhamnose reductase
MRIAVVGARGHLGGAIVREFGTAHEVVPLDRAALDITRAPMVDEVLGRIAPDVIINCAGYNAVDAAEDAPLDALAVNAFAVRSLARAARDHGARLVHYSTDFVFDGTGSRPYTEGDPPNPRSVYAVSKLLGEWFADDVARAYVLRVESLFGEVPGAPRRRGSLQAIVDTLAGGGTARVFVDRTVSPTFVIDAARATRALVERQAPAGLYHCVNSGAATWAEVAAHAAALLGVEPHLDEIRLADVSLKASRPQYCALSNAKLASIGIAMPSWQDALARDLAGRQVSRPRA